MEDTKHIFNVKFKMLKSTMDSGEMTNTHTFDIRPIYWTTMIIPGKGKITGTVDMYCMGRDIVSASATFYPTTLVKAIPKMTYSACIVFSGCTVFSASPMIYQTDSWSTS